MMTFNKHSNRKLRVLRIIVLVIILTSIIPIAVDRSGFNYFISILLLISSFIVSRFYRCPFCRRIFDIRKRISDDTCCSKCGKKL